MTQQIEVEHIKKLNIQPGETLVITVDIHSMPARRAQEYLDDIAKCMREQIPDPNIHIIVVPQSTTFAIIGSSQNVSTQPSDPLSDYDRAMGVIK